MPLRNYNNNERQITNNTYSSIAFSNSESTISQSRFTISYFNKLMKVTIGLRTNPNSGEQYATYDTDNPAVVYVPATKAEILRRMILKMREDDSIHNVCIELKNGLLKISDGKEFNSKNYCFTISNADNAGNVAESIYECKSNTYSGAFNYRDSEYQTEYYPTMELDALVMTLEEYYKASAYAQAAAIMEASMYRRDAQYQLIRSIADKVGVPTENGGYRQQSSGKSFLNNNRVSSNIPAEYEATTFDAIANSFPG